MRVPHQALRDTIAVEDLAGEGAIGTTFAESRNVRASVQNIQRLLEDEMGNQVTIDTLVIIRPEAGPVPPGSRVTVGSDQYRVVKAFPVPDYHSPSHWELMLRVWGVV